MSKMVQMAHSMPHLPPARLTSLPAHEGLCAHLSVIPMLQIPTNHVATDNRQPVTGHIKTKPLPGEQTHTPASTRQNASLLGHSLNKAEQLTPLAHHMGVSGHARQAVNLFFAYSGLDRPCCRCYTAACLIRSQGRCPAWHSSCSSAPTGRPRTHATSSGRASGCAATCASGRMASRTPAQGAAACAL
jgi:hypothetical protein